MKRKPSVVKIVLKNPVPIERRIENPLLWLRLKCGVRILDMKPKMIKPAMQIVEYFSLSYEPLAKALEISLRPNDKQEYLNLVESWMRDTTSLVAIDEWSGRICGVLVGRVIDKLGRSRTASRLADSEDSGKKKVTIAGKTPKKKQKKGKSAKSEQPEKKPEETPEEPKKADDKKVENPKKVAALAKKMKLEKAMQREVMRNTWMRTKARVLFNLQSKISESSNKESIREKERRYGVSVRLWKTEKEVMEESKLVNAQEQIRWSCDEEEGEEDVELTTEEKFASIPKEYGTDWDTLDGTEGPRRIQSFRWVPPRFDYRGNCGADDEDSDIKTPEKSRASSRDDVDIYVTNAEPIEEKEPEEEEVEYPPTMDLVDGEPGVIYETGSVLRMRALQHSLMQDIDIYKKYGVDRYYRIYLVVIHPIWKWQGVAHGLMTACLDMIRHFQITVCTGVFTSRIMQHIATAMGFKTESEQRYKKWKEGRKAVFKDTGEGNSKAALMTVVLKTPTPPVEKNKEDENKGPPRRKKQ